MKGQAQKSKEKVSFYSPTQIQLFNYDYLIRNLKYTPFNKTSVTPFDLLFHEGFIYILR